MPHSIRRKQRYHCQIGLSHGASMAQAMLASRKKVIPNVPDDLSYAKIDHSR